MRTYWLRRNPLNAQGRQHEGKHNKDKHEETPGNRRGVREYQNRTGVTLAVLFLVSCLIMDFMDFSKKKKVPYNQPLIGVINVHVALTDTMHEPNIYQI